MNEEMPNETRDAANHAIAFTICHWTESMGDFVDLSREITACIARVVRIAREADKCAAS